MGLNQKVAFVLWMLWFFLGVPLMAKEEKKEPVFRLHLLSEPHSLDPAGVRGISGSYLFSNLFRSLFRFDREKGLIPEGARHCHWEGPLKLNCELQATRWSDGTSVLASQYVAAFRRLLKRETKTLNHELILKLKNAQTILAGKAPLHSLGVRAEGPSRLIFEFDEKDSEFTFKLVSPALAPVREESFFEKPSHLLITNGPYQIESWQKGKSLILKPNPYYDKKENRPKVEVLFIEDDATALRLFQTGHINFLRRLTTDNIPVYRDHPGFLQIPQARFDYIGFGPNLAKQKDLRRALSLALDYQQLKELYFALGRPGCPSFPAGFMDKLICYNFDLEQAKKFYAKVPEKIKKQKWKLAFSKMGGDDIQKGMEWIQNQWKKNLGFQVSLEPVEQGMYLQQLSMEPADIFRKGVGLDRPTCLAGLEVFSRNDPENYIRWNHQDYEDLLEKMRSNNLKEESKKALCRQAVEILMNEAMIIPMGEIHFTMLSDQKFTGFEVNQMNQLDLTDLRPAHP